MNDRWEFYIVKTPKELLLLQSGLSGWEEGVRKIFSV